MSADKPADGINDKTGEFGPGVDQDTGAGVGDTGTPELADASGAKVSKDEESEKD